jgi:hypothetical protein
MSKNLFVPATLGLVMLITIAILMTAGCTDSTPGQQSQDTIAREMQRENPAAAMTVATGITTAPITQKNNEPAPPTGSSDGVILLDPVSDRYDGQEYLITGTTSLPVGTDLVLQIRPDTGTPPTGYDKEAVGSGAGSTAWIIEGNGTSNRTVIKGSMSGQGPGKWVAVLGNRIDEGKLLDKTVMGRHIGYAYFNQKQDPASK